MLKRILTISILIFISSSLFAIGFGFHVLEVKSSPEFGKGVFPTSVNYQFNFPMPGDSTLLTFRLDNGLDFRTLAQDPESGKLLAQYGNFGKFASFSVRDYSVLFDEFNLLFSQGFLRTSLSDNDLITISAAVGGRFEFAFESLSWMSDSNHVEALFWSDTAGTQRFNSYSGTPELSGDRKIMNTFLTFGLDIDLMKNDIVRKNGVKLSTVFKLSPSWMPLNDGSADYMISSTELNLAYTPFYISQGEGKNLSWFSMVIGNDTNYRFISGSKVPYYIQGGEIFSTRAANSAHVITNRTYIAFYGPQIIVKDLYPSVMVFHDFAYSFGKVLNMADPDIIGEYVGVFGMRAEFNMYNICKFFFETGTIYYEQFSHGKNNIKARFGFTMEI